MQQEVGVGRRCGRHCWSEQFHDVFGGCHRTYCRLHVHETLHDSVDFGAWDAVFCLASAKLFFFARQTCQDACAFHVPISLCVSSLFFEVLLLLVVGVRPGLCIPSTSLPSVRFRCLFVCFLCWPIIVLCYCCSPAYRVCFSGSSFRFFRTGRRRFSKCPMSCRAPRCSTTATSRPTSRRSSSTTSTRAWGTGWGGSSDLFSRT